MLYFSSYTEKIMKEPNFAEKLLNDLIHCIPKTNTCWSLDMQIVLQLKYSSLRHQQAVEPYSIERKLSSHKRKLLINTMEIIMKLIEEFNQHWNTLIGVGCSQSAVSEIGCKYIRKGL